MMTPQAATLSEQDILDIAAYYSAQDPAAKPK
ncbi:cytochrome c [Candidimonas sp. SYP-B2681]